MEENVVEKMVKYAEIVSVLEHNNISWNGLVDGLVETYHNDNPDYKLKQNPDWWNIGGKEEVIDSVISTFSKPK
jgi:hypothetical protein